MKRLRNYTGTDFYGVAALVVAGLEAEVRHGLRQGRAYSYLVFRDEAGIKWKIIPSVSHRGRVQSPRLHHRNRYGRRGFHSQHQRARGTSTGLRDLVAYIRRHEEYERRQRVE